MTNGREIGRWLRYAKRLAWKYGRGLHLDEQHSAAGWALATAIRTYNGTTPFAAYLARGVRQTVASDRQIVFNGGLTAYGSTKATRRPRKGSIRDYVAFDRGQDVVDGLDLMGALDGQTASTLRLHFGGESTIGIARCQRRRASTVARTIDAGINQLRKRLA